MKFKESRACSFVIVTLVYILATVVGIVTYLLLPFDFWLNLLIADVVATIVTFLFSVIFNNASVYDPYWSVQPIVIIFAFAIGKGLTAAGILLMITITLWGIRLTANWAYTFHGLNHQDWRYTMLKEKTGIFYPIINFIGIHVVPTLIVYACVMPAVAVLYYAPNFNPLCILFIFVSLAATLLQGVSDWQMQKFRREKSEGKASGFIHSGLWKYSRHPNYLGEILMWWGVALAATILMPNRWYLLFGAVSNTLLFFFVSIPMADGRMANREGFDEYKKHTRMLLPIKK